MRILAIDDEPYFVETLYQYFDDRGYDIDSASTGDDGLKLFMKNTYDVAILDLKMVGLNGDEVMKVMRGVAPDVKIIFISAFTDDGETPQRLIDSGAYAYVEKPLSSFKDLEELINKAVGNNNNEKG
jgi:two-component system, NtrC family, response regulator AtoC